jgi:hypothetical protein
MLLSGCEAESNNSLGVITVYQEPPCEAMSGEAEISVKSGVRWTAWTACSSFFFFAALFKPNVSVKVLINSAVREGAMPLGKYFIYALLGSVGLRGNITGHPSRCFVLSQRLYTH